MIDVLNRVETPQLVKLASGKVRESFRVNGNQRLIVVTDRISAFDKMLETPIPKKGAVLNGLANWWFAETQDIIPNHLIRQVDPNASLVREAAPLRVEVVMRGYLTGSMWRGYRVGNRVFSGVEVEDGLTRNQRFPTPLLTPTTKEKVDRPITPDEIVRSGLVDAATWDRVVTVAHTLFERGTRILEEKGILLVDTKYEFGLVDGELTLIDEIHTPDSSRYWFKEDWETDPLTAVELDKEYVRQWLLANKTEAGIPNRLPADVIAETTRRYLDVFERIVGEPLALGNASPSRRLGRGLVIEGLMKPGFVAIVMGSKADLPFCETIREALALYPVFTELRVMSAHKNGEDILALAREYNGSLEPGAVIAVAGRSNGLGGALAANLNLPVINCPPFGDKTDLMLNVGSSLMMPSQAPAGTAVDPGNAAALALRCLNLPDLRMLFDREIEATKAGQRAADAEVRGR
ncbi:MAG: phosphoribosylaminoimidazolesuccinocarboxamide synthase [Pseudomonadota bacterium]